MKKHRPFTAEDKQFMLDHAANMTTTEIAKRLGRTPKVILSWLLRNKVPFQKQQGHFSKGLVPWNAGKPMSKETKEKVANTFFKKGGIPKNHRPVGSERTTREGLIEIKIAEPNVWKLKQRHIWEEHNGAIPPGYKIVFRDGNPKNLDIANLEKIHTTNLLFRNAGRPEQDEKVLETQWLLRQLAKLIDKHENKQQ